MLGPATEVVKVTKPVKPLRLVRVTIVEESVVPLNTVSLAAEVVME